MTNKMTVLQGSLFEISYSWNRASAYLISLYIVNEN
jgi:hypothetical protein